MKAPTAGLPKLKAQTDGIPKMIFPLQGMKSQTALPMSGNSYQHQSV